jgi:dTDP-4-dehydrorhamnose reductase
MKLWITGAAGLVGTALQKLCLAQGIEFVATSRDQVDISSLQHVKRFLHSEESKGVTHIVNCAAYTNVDEAEKEPETAHLVNAVGPENLGIAAHMFDLKIIHISTDYVFGLEGSKPFTETDDCTPASVYARTKHEGEQRLLDSHPQACILRTSWVFGKGGKNFVSSLLEKIQKEEKISVVSDQQSRLTYVEDLAEALLALLCHSGIFHFANQGETSRFEVAKCMVETAKARGMPVACQELIAVNSAAFPQIAKRPIYSALDTKKIESLLGIAPRSWEIALKEYIHAL